MKITELVEMPDAVEETEFGYVVIIGDQRIHTHRDAGNPEARMVTEWIAAKKPIKKFIKAPPTPEMVKAEANRRITAGIAEEWKQRNMLAQAVFALVEELIRQGIFDPAKWPPETRALYGGLTAVWRDIDAIRSKSDEIEAKPEIPQTFKDDEHWR
ncbi:hypothetical protein [Hoeflea sp. TYP-13]|uniref:hypothetical protein n=1 Tax=Hoeflea sp. TYP-13 TaxID=3230023 RepID=UPI0034C65A70